MILLLNEKDKHYFNIDPVMAKIKLFIITLRFNFECSLKGIRIIRFADAHLMSSVALFMLHNGTHTYRYAT